MSNLTEPMCPPVSVCETRRPLPRVRVLLVDDHPFVRDGVKGILAASGNFEVVGEAGTAAAAIEMLDILRPDLLITDLRLPDADGTRVLEAARKYKWGMYSVVLSAFENEDDMVTVARLGVQAYIVKTSSGGELLDALDRVMNGQNVLLDRIPEHLRVRLKQKDLTLRELQVLEMIARGLGNKQIAVATGVTDNTVKAHLKSIFRKLGITTRSEAALIAVRRGLLA